MFPRVCLTFLLFSQYYCASVRDIYNEDVLNKWLYPNLGLENSSCRNHSNFYQQELDKTVLWATEMYDASAKFPSGILFGSVYSLGQYDQCLDIEVPYGNKSFSGKYCMAKITVTPNFKYKMTKNVDFEFGNYKNYYNVSAWSKMLDYQNKNSKAPRNEMYFSFCLPSSCTEEDLQKRLNDITEKLNVAFNDFSLEIEIEEQSCQVKTRYIFSAGDITFMAFIAFSLLFVILSSFYDMCSRSEGSLLRKAPGHLHDFIICFSIPKNLKKMASESNNEDGLDCLAGIKVISMFLIIMGHRCMFTFGAPMANPSFIEKMYSRFEAAAILNGPIIVDTFFLISGFLASYFTLKALKNFKSSLHLIIIYVHRLIRMTPSYAVVLAFYCTIFASMGNGPFWHERVGVEKQRCQQNWWANILYVNNYVNADQMCIFQSWYIACDLHYFLLIPVLVILLRKNTFWGISAIVALILSSILVVVSLVYINKEDAILLLYTKLLRDPINSPAFRNIYIPSHMRSSPYFVGVMTGYIKYRMKDVTYKLPKWLNASGWILAATIVLTTIHLGFIFYLPQFSETTIVAAIYAGFHHFTFSVGIAWLIIAVSSGKGPWIEPILTFKPFILMSRISYTAFLCHGAVQLYTAAEMRQPNYVGVFSVFYATFGDIAMAYLFGFALSMVYEAPIIGLEKIIFGRTKTENSADPETVEDGTKSNEVLVMQEKININNNL